MPGHVDGTEAAVRAVVGQQISVRAARELADRLVERYGEPIDLDGFTHLFPTAPTLAAVDPHTLAMPAARGAALLRLCTALAGGAVTLEPGADRAQVSASLLAIPGVGPWTAAYIALRALGHPDVFLPGDTGTRDGLRALGFDPDLASEVGHRWRPWRSYAQMHVWRAAAASRRASSTP